MAGADRPTVKRMLCEELELDNADYESRWLMLDFSERGRPSVVHSRPDEADLAAAVLADVDDGWRPWHGIRAGACAAVDPAFFPPATHAAMASRGWRRAIAAPVDANGRLVAVLLLVGRVPPSYPLDGVKRNIEVRTQGLVKATRLLFERWAEQDHLRSEATSDALTGLGNSRALTAALGETERAGSVLFVDIDHFKAVNDQYGHQIGDAVLVEIANRIVAACRQGDVVTRFGGDEFVILLDGADESLATSIGWRVVEAVAAPLDIEGGPDRISVSVGLSPRCDVDALDAADRAMLQAKRSGRSRLSTLVAG
ncbi:MAG: GGDEF domain-containing protein [Ilumatobacteraceae bacterium]